MADILRASYAEFEFLAYEPVLMVSERDNAAIVSFARLIHRQTGKSVQMMIVQFLRFRDRKIVELREFMDSFRAVEQILGHKIDLK